MVAAVVKGFEQGAELATVVGGERLIGLGLVDPTIRDRLAESLLDDRAERRLDLLGAAVELLAEVGG